MTKATRARSTLDFKQEGVRLVEGGQSGWTRGDEPGNTNATSRAAFVVPGFNADFRTGVRTTKKATR